MKQGIIMSTEVKKKFNVSDLPFYFLIWSVSLTFIFVILYLVY